LNVSVQYVSKWKAQYEAYGASSLSLAFSTVHIFSTK